MTYVPETWVDYTTPCIDAAHLNAIEHGIDIAQGDVMVLRGLTANRPAFDAELVGRLYFATDAPYEISRDNGGGWDVVGYTSDLFTALGTLEVGSGAGAAAPLGIGAAGEILTVAGGTATWAAGAAGAWNLIAETILGAPAATVTFAAIPGTYRALIILGLARTDRVSEAGGLGMRANADAGANYDWSRLVDGAPAAAVAATEARVARVEAANSNANGFGLFQTYFYGYALTTIYKRWATVSHGQFGDMSGTADLQLNHYNCQWRNTAAITSLTLLPTLGGANIATGSRFALYGIT